MGYHAGNKINKGNLKRAARRVGIHTPMQLSILKIRKEAEIMQRKNASTIKTLGGDTESNI